MTKSAVEKGNEMEENCIKGTELFSKIKSYKKFSEEACVRLYNHYKKFESDPKYGPILCPSDIGKGWTEYTMEELQDLVKSNKVDTEKQCCCLYFEVDDGWDVNCLILND